MEARRRSSLSKRVTIREDLREYYQSNDDGLIICKLCQDPKGQIYVKDRGWFNFERHIVRNHNIPQEKFKKEHSKTDDITRHFLPTIKSTYNQSDCYKRDDTRQIRFEQDCVDLVAIDGLPLQVTTGAAFVKLIRHQNGALRIPSRQTVGRRLSKHYCEITRENVAKIEKIDKLHITLDLWSSISRISVLGVKIHFIDENWKLQSWTVSFRHFSHKKTGHNIRLFIKELLETELKIRPNQIASVMADNAAENIKAFDLEEFQMDTDTHFDDEDFLMTIDEETEDNDIDVNDHGDYEVEDVDAEDERLLESELDKIVDWSRADFQRLGCVSHALQLVIKDIIKANKTASALLKIVTEMVSFFHKSNFWSEKLLRKTKLSIVAIGKTRWNSFCLALERLVMENFVDKMNEVILEAKGKKVSSPDPISPTNLSLMVELCSILQPVKELTDRVQSDKVTSSLVLTGIICLYSALSNLDVKHQDLTVLRTNLCLGIVERFASPIQESYRGRGPRKQLLKVFEKKQYIIASLLDPRIKLKPFQAILHDTFGLGKHLCSQEKALQILHSELDLHEVSSTEELESINLVSQSSEVEVSQPSLKRTKTSIFDAMFSESQPTSDTGCHSVVSHKSYTEEVEEYLSENILNITECPLTYWRKRKQRYPQLCKLARMYLSLPASTGSVERLFSIAGSIARARRNRIIIATLEKILLYREWRIRNSSISNMQL